MPGQHTTEAVRKSVTALGRTVGLSPQEFNVGLKLAGLLDGEPGAWRRTEQGKLFAAVHDHTNGYGGRAYRAWETTTWRDTVIDKLDLSDAGIARIRQLIAERTLAQKLAIDAARATADTALRQAQSAKRAAESSQTISSATPAQLIAGLSAVAAAVGLYKGLPLVRRRLQQRADAQPVRDAPPAA